MFKNLFFFIFISSTALAQSYEITLNKSQSPIYLDGVLNEAAWSSAQEGSGFYLNFPYDSSYVNPELQTTVKLAFDENYLYIAAICKQKREDIRISSLKRDFDEDLSDFFAVNFDTFEDKLNGFHFGVNPHGVQREGLIHSGYDVSSFWDNKWSSAVKIHDEYWVVEMAIPFKTLRYKVNNGGRTWNVNFVRKVLKENQISSWRPVPRNFGINNLAYTGKLIWTEAPPSPGVNISVIPYLSTSLASDFPRNADNLNSLGKSTTKTFTAGLDAKIGITPALNLDLTLNPDFSQVEVDRQQANLSRFELFFPERRQFFLENDDLFGSFGFPDTRPFFSRRIGIARNPLTGMSARVPILAGARLSGKLNDNWRVGLMNMQTRSVNFGEGVSLPSSNYTVGVLQRKLFQRSSIGGIFVNKQNNISELNMGQSALYHSYNRVAGLELNINSADGRFESETYYHQSFSPGGGNDASSLSNYIGYTHPNFYTGLGITRIGEDYNAEVGFVPRSGNWSIFRPLMFTFHPKDKEVARYINAYGLDISGSDVLDLNGKVLDSETEISAYVNNAKQAALRVSYKWQFSHLFMPYDPTNAFDNPNPDRHKTIVPLPVGNYRFPSYGVSFESSVSNPFYGTIAYNTGKYYIGNADFVNVTAAYRLQPYGLLAFDGFYSNIRMPKPHNSAEYWLLGPRAELAFTKTVFFSTFFQYNSQTNNTNINARFQWRYKPVSDLFLVYTENYFAEDIPKYGVNAWSPKDRAIVLKLTYWLNI